MKHLWGVRAKPLTSSFPSSGRNKFLCFSESNMTEKIKILALSNPGVLLMTGKAWSIATMQPLLEFTPEKNWCFLMLTLRTSWAREMMQKEQENFGLPMPKLHSPASPPMLRGLMRVAELCFPSAATLCGSGSQSCASGTVPPCWQKPYPCRMFIQGVQHSEFTGLLCFSFGKSSDLSSLWILNYSITVYVKQVFFILHKVSVLSFSACPTSA